MAFLFGVIGLVSMGFVRNNLDWLIKSRSAQATIVRLVLLALACLILVDLLDPAFGVVRNVDLGWRNALPVVLVAFFIYALCGRLVFSFWLTAVIAYALFAVNAIKVRNMDMPVMPGDLALGHQLLGNIGFFEHYVAHGVTALAVVIGFLVVSWLAWRLERGSARPSWVTRACWLVIPVICLVTMFGGTGFWASVYSDQALRGFQLWAPAESVSRSGLVAGLVRMSQEAEVVIPEADRNLVQRFANQHAGALEKRESRAVPATLPDIVVVQSEAFFDPGIMKQIAPGQFDPQFERLSRTGISGFLTTPAYGGGTIRTEFETLTGYPMGAFPSVVYPYYGLAAKWMPSVPRRLVSMGYSTTLFHPFSGDFWNRREVMPELGFQKMYFEKAFAGAKRAGRYVSDRALFRFVLGHLKGGDANPQYVMAITMENHGPWGHDPGKLVALLDGHTLPSGLSASGKRELVYYLAHLLNGDAALGDFAEKLMARKRWTILLFYGDHLPALDHAFHDVGFDDGRTHAYEHTHYMLLSNRPLPPHILNLDAYELPGLLFDAIGLPMDGYLAFDGAVRQAWAEDHFKNGAGFAQVLYNAARMEVAGKRKLAIKGRDPDAPPALDASCGQGSCSNDELQLLPAATGHCGAHAAPFAVTVRWNAHASDTDYVRIWVRNPTVHGKYGTATLWAAKEASGSARTGKWVFPGTRIILTSAVTGQKLSVLTVSSDPCKAG